MCVEEAANVSASVCAARTREQLRTERVIFRIARYIIASAAAARVCHHSGRYVGDEDVFENGRRIHQFEIKQRVPYMYYLIFIHVFEQLRAGRPTETLGGGAAGRHPW